MKKIFLTGILFFTFIVSHAQYNERDSNRIGISFGLNQFTLNTDNFQTKPGMGWNAGLSVRGNFFNDWDAVYQMQFSENNFFVLTDNGFSTAETNYKLASAQISFVFSYKIIENHLSVEIGPLVKINGKLNVDKLQENKTITGTSLMAKDIVAISKFNFYPIVGITAGVKHFRLNFSYQYGANNMLENLNSQNLGINFKGNSGIANLNLIVYL